MTEEKIIEQLKKLAASIYLTGYDQGIHETHDEDLRTFALFWNSANPNTWKEQFEAIIKSAYQAGREEAAREIHSFLYECENYDDPEFNHVVDILAGKVKEEYIDSLTPAPDTARTEECSRCHHFVHLHVDEGKFACSACIQGGGPCQPRTEEKSANEMFEELAEQFYKDTGFMAPGKDDVSGVSYEKRTEAWYKWLSSRKHKQPCLCRCHLGDKPGTEAFHNSYCIHCHPSAGQGEGEK